jgi:hypothetical protein
LASKPHPARTAPICGSSATRARWPISFNRKNRVGLYPGQGHTRCIKATSDEQNHADRTISQHYYLA